MAIPQTIPSPLSAAVARIEMKSARRSGSWFSVVRFRRLGIRSCPEIGQPTQAYVLPSIVPAHKPHGRPNKNHATNSRVQVRKIPMTYGIINATIVPTPAFLSYFWAKTTTNAK